MHVYQVVIYKLVQHYAHITFQKQLCMHATWRHVSVAATTNVREDNPTECDINKLCVEGAAK